MLVATVTEPGVVSPSGARSSTSGPPTGLAVVVDGNVETPGRGCPASASARRARDPHDVGGGLTVYAGHGSVATPGAFAAFGRAHERHGAAPWAELLAPAISAARDGFPLGAAAASYLELVHDSIFGWDEQTARSTAPTRARPTPRGRRCARPSWPTPSPTSPAAGGPTSHRRPGRAGRHRHGPAGRPGHRGRPVELRRVRADRPAQHAARAGASPPTRPRRSADRC